MIPDPLSDPLSDPISRIDHWIFLKPVKNQTIRLSGGKAFKRGPTRHGLIKKSPGPLSDPLYFDTGLLIEGLP